MRVVVLTALMLGACAKTEGKLDATGIVQPSSDLMVEPRRIKSLRKGGDLKKYTPILVARNGELVDQVRGLQGYASKVSGAPIIKGGSK